MAVALNTIVGPGTFSTSFTGSGNIFIGNAALGQFPNNNNAFIVTNGTGAIIHGDMDNNNIALGWSSLTGPNYQGGQGVVFLPVATTAPSSAMTGGLAIYTDGMSIKTIDTSGNSHSIGNLGIASQKGSTNQTISNNTNTTVVLGTAVINPTSPDLTMNLGASSITAVNAGIYRINARIQWTSSPASGRYQLILSIGGVSTYEIAFSVPNATGLTTTFTPGTDQGIGIDEVVSLAANTAILIVANQNSGSSQTIVGGTTASAELIVQRIA